MTRTWRRGVVGLAVLASLLAPAAAHAADHSVGLRLSAGGNYLTEPDGVPGDYEGLGFAGDAGGVGYGVALYGEARVLTLLGVELSLGQDFSTLQREVTYSSVVEVTERLRISTTRLGGLVKLVVPLPLGRFWLGAGPEWVLASGVDAENEITRGAQYVTNRGAVESLIRGRERGSTLLAGGTGLAFTLGPVEVPLELRAARNLSDEADWEDRVALDLQGSELRGYGVVGRSSWEFRLAAGVGLGF